MEAILIIVRQIMIMFLLSGVGYLLFCSGKNTETGSKTLANILVYVVLPCVIVKGFLISRTAEHITGLLISMAAAAVLLGIAMLIGHLRFPKDGIGSFAAAFSNAGFFGVPLISAVIGQEAVFYSAAFIAFLNLLQWTYGVSLLTSRQEKLSLKRVVQAPFMIAILIGVGLFLVQPPIPGVIMDSLNHLCSVNTPLAMFTLGVYLAKVNWKQMFLKKELYRITALRLVIIPLLSLLILTPIPPAWNGMKYAVLLAAACPVGANVAIYAQLYNKDYAYAVETIVISTVCSIVTMPMVLWAAGMLWR